MVLQDTPYPLVLQAMLGEAGKVAFFQKKQASKAQREFRRQQQRRMPYPLYWLTTYTVPSSRNTYLVWFEAMSDEEVSKGTFVYGSALLVNEENRRQSVYQIKHVRDQENPEAGHQILFNVYTGHFFSRYRERGLWGARLSTHELMVRYLARNDHFLAGLEFSKLNLNSDKYPDGAACQVFDGVVFLTEKDFVMDDDTPVKTLRYNTFMPMDQLGENQSKAIVKPDELMRRLSQAYVPQS